MSISLQPWKLKLLSIPKSYPESIASCTHAIVKNIFFPRSRDTLFSLTQNALELAIVADVDVIAEDFESLKLEGMMVTEDVFCAFMAIIPMALYAHTLCACINNADGGTGRHDRITGAGWAHFSVHDDLAWISNKGA
ncbi:unnamed protein product [Mortierella alpina]